MKCFVPHRNEVITKLAAGEEEGKTMDAYSNFQLPVSIFEHIERSPLGDASLSSSSSSSTEQQPQPNSNHPDAFLSGMQRECAIALEHARPTDLFGCK